MARLVDNGGRGSPRLESGLVLWVLRDPTQVPSKPPGSPQCCGDSKDTAGTSKTVWGSEDTVGRRRSWGVSTLRGRGSVRTL